MFESRQEDLADADRARIFSTVLNSANCSGGATG